MTRNRFGDGWAYYLGTWLEDESALATLLLTVAVQSGVAPAPFRFGRGVEAIHRRTGAQEFWFLFNYREEPTEVEMQGTFTDMRAARTVSGTVRLDAKSYLVLTRA